MKSFILEKTKNCNYTLFCEEMHIPTKLDYAEINEAKVHKSKTKPNSE